MCYPKPGPRCSAHARKALKRALAAHAATPNSETFAAVQEAKQDYFATPSGMKELQKAYNRTGNMEYLNQKALGQLRRDKSLLALGIDKEKRRKIVKPEQIISHALRSKLSYDAALPKWFNEYARQVEDKPYITQRPKMIDVIETSEGPAAVIWEHTSSDDHDRFPIEEKGTRIQKLSFRHLRSGEVLGYVKVAVVDEPSWQYAYGNDNLSPLRYDRSQRGGYYDTHPIEKKHGHGGGSQVEELTRAYWIAAAQRGYFGVKNADGEYVSSSTAAAHVPSQKQMESDLRIAGEKVTPEAERVKRWGVQPSVEMSRMELRATGQGLGTAAYIYTARILGQEGQTLRASGVQTEDAKKIWTRMKSALPRNVKPVKQENPFLPDAPPQDTYILDFRE